MCGEGGLDRHSRILNRRSVGVPKGFLIFLVMHLLKIKPMSGSELMDEIKGITKWRPSPGSIYPLLSKMRKMDVIVQIESEKPILKRFALTEKGLEEFERMKKEDVILMDRFRATRKIYWTMIENLDEELFQARDKLITAISEVAHLIDENPEASKRVREIIEKALGGIDGVKKNLEEAN